MAGLGNKSALASLTATYTDSEDEGDVETENAASDRENMFNELTSGKDSSRNRPSAGDERVGEPKVNSGLVSYYSYEDQIDDETVGSVAPKKELPLDDDEFNSGYPSAASPEAENPEGSPDKKHSEGSTELVQASETVTTIESGKSRIPNEPSGKPTELLQNRVAQLYARKQAQQMNLNVYIQENKQFRNPSIYEKLIKHCNIDELGTNYSPNIYNPHGWAESSFYDELAKIQKADMDRREKEKKDRSKVEFISGTVKKPTLPSMAAGGAAASSASDMEGKRKSKWDQRGSLLSNLMPTALPTLQPSVMQPNLTTNVTGTKSTVISAFGHLPAKKSK